LGLDGTGQSIAIVGDSAPLLSDLSAFKTRYNLPANAPRVFFYGGTDPGINGDLVETNLDLEWASAIAPRATINYV
jgi:subtilase family serine protease